MEKKTTHQNQTQTWQKCWNIRELKVKWLTSVDSSEYFSTHIAFLGFKLKPTFPAQNSETEMSILCNNNNKFLYHWGRGGGERERERVSECVCWWEGRGGGVGIED